MELLSREIVLIFVVKFVVIAKRIKARSEDIYYFMKIDGLTNAIIVPFQCQQKIG
jgi:hypothetical protein